MLGQKVMISVKNVTKVYHYYEARRSIASFLFPKREKVVALDGVSLDIREGEIYGLLGPNGAGKTTLIKMICGLLKVTSGEIRINGNGVFGAQKDIGLLLGDSMIYNLMTGRDNLEYVACLYKVSDCESRIKELTDFLEIGEWLDQYVSEYSLGMKVKLCLARALVHDPPILLLDEPTLGLDPRFAMQMRNKIRELRKTVILTTHYMEEAEFLSDRIGILHRGRFIAEGTPEELKTHLARSESPTMTDVFVTLTTETL